MNRLETIVCAALMAASLSLGACEKNQSGGSAESDVSRPTWLLQSAPGNAVDILQVKAGAKEGDQVTVRGIIGGGAHPLSRESPVIRLVDSNLHNRCTAEAGHCDTPWDYCCASPEDLASNGATVMIVDSNGKPIGGDLKAQGLSELDEVVVVGTVAPRPTPEVLTIRATGVYRVGG